MDENTLTTHLGTGLIFVFTEKILWIISLILKISSLLPPGSFGGPDANLKLDIMKLNSHIILIKCIISVFSDTLKIYDKKSNNIGKIGTKWKYFVSASHRKFRGGAGGRGWCHTNAPGWWWRTIIIWLVSYFDKIEVGRITKALSQ